MDELPVELLQQIGACLPPAAQCALRATCWRIADALPFHELANPQWTSVHICCLSTTLGCSPGFERLQHRLVLAGRPLDAWLATMSAIVSALEPDSQLMHKLQMLAHMHPLLCEPVIVIIGVNYNIIRISDNISRGPSLGLFGF